MGLPTTCYDCFVRWRKLGLWDRIFEEISKAYEGDLQMVDSSSIRDHPTIAVTLGAQYPHIRPRSPIQFR